MILERYNYDRFTYAQKYSDGSDSLCELLTRVENKKLNTISITDHNTALAYEKWKKINQVLMSEVGLEIYK